MKRLLAVTVCVFLLSPNAFAASEVKEVVSPHGIKAWLVEEHAIPLVAVKIVFKESGTAYDPSGKYGRAAMTAAMMMEGAGDMDSKTFNEALESHAVQLNFEIDEDLFHASVETLSEQKDLAFSYLGQALTKPRFDSEALDRVRSQTLSILTQKEQDPHYLLHLNWQKLAFGSHPYSHPLLGTKDTVSSLSRSDLRDFTAHYLTRENMLIAVVGDITPEELSRLLDAQFSALPEHYTPDTKVADVQLPTAAKQVVVDLNVPQTAITFGTNGVKRSDPDYYAAYVMNQILGGSSLSTRLAQEIREKRGLAYTVFSQVDPMQHASLWQGGFATRSEKVGEAVQTLRDTLKDFSQNGPSDEEVTNAKQYLTGSFVLNLDSNADIANYLISMQLHNLGRDYLERRNGFINAVTKNEVKAVAAKLTDPDKLLVVMVGKPNLNP